VKILLKTLFLLSFIIADNNSAQVYLGDYTSFSALGNSVTINADTSSLKIIFYKPDIVRIDFHPSPTTIIDSSFIVIRDTNEIVGYNLENFSDRIEISTQAMLIICQKYPVRLAVKRADGELLLTEPQSGGVAVNGNERIVNFILDNNDHFYGTGERGTDLDKRGQSFSSYNTQIGGYNTPLPTMNINVPFLANKKGYAVYFDNTYPGFFDLGNSDPLKFSYKVTGGEMSYYLFVAKTIPEQLEKYTWLTGRQPLPPKWALGYIQSKFGYRNESQAVYLVQTMRQEQIPCDAVVLDLYWFKYMGDISWDFVSWPDPFQIMQDFLNEGIKTIVITEPYIIEYSSNFSAAVSNNYLAFSQPGNPVLIPNWWSCGCDAGLLDLTNPAAKQWWWSKHPAFWGDQLSGIWTDLGEPEAHPPTMNHYLGSRDRVHNVFDFFWSQLMYNGINQIRPDKRVFNLTRSGFAGSQRYSVIPWSGDVAKSFGGLKVQLPMLLNMGMSGLTYHNSDIGGFCCGTTTPELYVRWMQYGTFCPITRAHGIDSQPTEPWGFGTAAEEICRKYISLRYQLLPYIYTMAYENYSTGMPLARPLFFEYSGVEFLNNYSDEYLWGDNFLVSPVVEEGLTSKNIYIPEGGWVDFFSDQVYRGPQNIVMQVPIDKLPLFVRRGSIIPMLRVMDYVDEFPADTMVLEIYPAPGTEAHFTLYEDDGESLDYQSGSYAMTEFSQNISAGDELNIIVNPSIGDYIGKLTERTYLSSVHHMLSVPTYVYKNGAVLTQRNSYGELRNNPEGYYYDNSRLILYVQIKAETDSLYQITAGGITLIINDQNPAYPEKFVLEQNYPNPFNPATTFWYSIPGESKVIIKIFDVLGNEIRTLVNEVKPAGRYEVVFNAVGLPSGVYFYRIQAGTFTNTRKMILLR
jgi:alpha-glucosidase (family GH31 glycosyl hydrolase)